MYLYIYIYICIHIMYIYVPDAYVFCMIKFSFVSQVLFRIISNKCLKFEYLET